MDSPRPSSRRNTLNIPSKPDSSLAEWTSKIKELQRQVDDDEEAETRRLEAEIAASRQARLRRSTGYASRSSSVDLCELYNLHIDVFARLTSQQHRAPLRPLRELKSARALQMLPSLPLIDRETRTMLSRSCWGRVRHHRQLHNRRLPSRLASPSALPNPCP